MPDALRQSYGYCQALARREARNFYYSFLTLPRDRFRAMCALYAFMRVTDDLSDSGASMHSRGAALDDWQAQLRSALAGEAPGHPSLPALADAVARYNVPARHLEEVITGVRMDLRCPRYESFEDLSRYCYHVAGAVGLACIHIWGFRDQRAIPAAIDCGLAFQLTNILRDVREDAQRGRLYLPLEDLARFGLEPEEVSDGAADPRVRQLLAFEAGRARQYYAKARLLVDHLEPCGRPVLETMLAIYGGLLGEMERRGFDVFSRRVELSRARKWRLVLRAAARAGWLRLWGGR
jgi:phytoene synthase